MELATQGRKAETLLRTPRCEAQQEAGPHGKALVDQDNRDTAGLGMFGFTHCANRMGLIATQYTVTYISLTSRYGMLTPLRRSLQVADSFLFMNLNWQMDRDGQPRTS